MNRPDSYLSFSSRMKMADLLKGNRELLYVFARFGMELGVREASVEQVCRRHGVSPDLFLLLCAVTSYRDFKPEVRHLAGLNSVELVGFLQSAHEYFLHVQFPAMRQRLKALGGSAEAILDEFLTSYYNEAVNHFDYEEQVVFPYIAQLIAGQKPEEYDISQFERNHSNIDEKLSDLQNIIIKYLPSDSSEARIELLEDLFRLESDLSSHAKIEDKVLTPMVQQLERQAR